MTHPLFEKHQAKLQSALDAISSRGHWSAYAEMPSPKVYGESAAAEGKAAFDALRGQTFALQQPGTQAWAGGEDQ